MMALGDLILLAWTAMAVTACKTQTQMQLAIHVILPIVLVNVLKAMKAG
jgi:hypothetical protein